MLWQSDSLIKYDINSKVDGYTNGEFRLYTALLYTLVLTNLNLYSISFNVLYKYTDNGIIFA